MSKKQPIDLTQLRLEELEDQITELAGHLNAANYRWLTLIAEFDRRNGWCDGRLPSCAHWLNFKVGLNLGAAREKIRVAHALEGLPKIAASMARGELSYSKVRALTRIACDTTEDSLLMMALHGTAHHVERLVRHYRQVEHAEQLASEERQVERCKLSYWYDSDGSLIVQGRIPALQGALFEQALEAAMEAVPATEPISPKKYPLDWDDPDEPHVELRTYGARRADALTLMAASFLRHGPAQSTADRYQVVVHVDAATLKNYEPGRCQIEHGPSITPDAARQITCDSSLVRLIENDEGEPLDVGRKTRSISPALRRALSARDTGCRFPGCTFHRYVDAHHIEHWADGGETKLSNLVTLCRAHHRMVHKGEIVIKACEGGGWQFLSADGRAYQGAYRQNRPSYEWNALHEVHEAQGVYIDARTAATRWAGERMDYDLAIFGLFSSLARANRVSAETSEAS